MTTIKTIKDGTPGEVELDDALFGERLHPVVLREAVLMYEANRRQGTVQTRTRRFVNGSTAKIYRQKHTGRARHGDRKAPLFRGGGVAHGPHPRDFSYAIPRKAKRRALQVALAGKLRDGELCLWEGARFETPSTKAARKALEALGAADSALIVAPETVDGNLLLSVRNLPYVRALPAREVSAYDVVAHKHLVLLDGALDVLGARVGADEGGE